MRLFLAIDLSEDLKKTITGTMHNCKAQGVKGRYSPSQNLHLTLAFIGEMKSADPVKKALENLSAKPFRLTLSGWGNFGDILWIGVKGNQGLSGLAAAARQSLKEAGIPFDEAKFVPHITMIRGASGSWKAVPAPKGEMMVKKVSLMKSEQKNGKTCYTEIWSVPIQNGRNQA